MTFVPSRPESRWDIRLAVLLAALLAWRLLYIVISPLNLIADEAYYWDWSRHLAWGYFSKPPMIAWVIALGTKIFGSTAFGVRFFAAFMSTGCLLAIYGLARRLYGARVGFWAVLLAAATPGGAVSGLLMTIDAPFLFFWAISLYTFWRALENREPVNVWWILSGLAVGLGLLSKQTMIGFPVLAILFVIASDRDRSALKRLGFYIFLVLPVAMFIPVITWNMRHDWVTLFHTMHHFEGRRSLIDITTFFDLLGTQLGFYSPVTWALLALVGCLCLIRFRGMDRRARYLLIFSILPLAGIFILSFRQRVQGNWPAPFYYAGFVFLAAWGCGALAGGRRTDRWRKWFRTAAAVGGGMTVLVLLLPWIMSMPGLAGSKIDPTYRLKGWEELGRQVGAAWNEANKEHPTFLVSTKRQTVSQMAFYVPGQPRVRRWPDRPGMVTTQYELWPGPVDKVGWNGLIVLEASENMDPALAGLFDNVEKLSPVVVSEGSKKEQRYELYLGHNLKEWP